MKVLVVGSGGREHALCWKLSQSERLGSLFAAPGNPGIESLARCWPVATDDVDGLVELVEREGIDFTVVGPEVPLTLGLVDRLEERGRRAFGPQRDAARLEGSKSFAKEFMQRHKIPTAAFEVVQDRDAAKAAVERWGLPAVLKADGLAAGKGVLIPQDEAELDAALHELFEERRFGAAADEVVVEECLVGEEVSMIAVSDGEHVLPLASSKDYKRIGEGDKGPNTGGMGAHSPAGVISPVEEAAVTDSVFLPVVQGMAAEGAPFRGVLYAGLMLTAEGPRVLEFNVRFGDPECQPLMMRLESDLLDVLERAAAGDLQGIDLSFRSEAAACVVLANEGYPGSSPPGAIIAGLDAATDAAPAVVDRAVFHAGTARDAGAIAVAGGRVLNVCALGDTLGTALERAYARCEEIDWPGKVYRRDIGRRVLG